MLHSIGERTPALVLHKPKPLLGYAAAVLLAVLAQVCRIPLHPATAMPFITYVPFMLFAIWYGGFGPGILASALCTFESIYFAIDPVGSFDVADPQQWIGVALLAATGFISAALFENLRRAHHSKASAQAQFTDLRNQLAAIVDSSDDAIYSEDLATIISSWNRSAERLFGYSASEMVGRSTTLLLPPDSVDEESAILERLRMCESVSHYETRRMRKDGSQVFVSVSVSPIKDSLGRLVGASKIARDITQRKLDEEVHARQARELHERTTLLDGIIEYSPDAIAVLRGPEFKFALINPAYQALQPDVPMAGRSVAEVWPDGAALVLPLLEGVRDTLIPFHSPALLFPVRTSPKGPTEERFFSVSYVPPLGSEGAAPSILVVAVDVTQIKRTEISLRDSAERLNILVEHAPAALAMFDREMRYLHVSRRWKQSFELGDRDLRGASHYEVFPETTQRWKDIYRRGLEGETLHSDSELSQRSDGSEKWMRWNVLPWQSGEGKTGGIVMFAEDITARKQAEENLIRFNAELEKRVCERTAQLEASNREMESFTYSVSHDLRAPLRGIDGWSCALVEDYGPGLDDRARQYLDRVRSEAQRMGHLIDDLLHLSRLARSELSFTSVDLTALALTIVARLKDADPSRDTEFVIAPGLSTQGDAHLLEIALTNLFDNAVKFSSKRAHARVEFGASGRCDREKPGPQFYIRDNGAGFDMAYANQLFAPFQRLHSCGEFPGSGIGLATVQRILHRHGGSIVPESHPQQGATFYFTIGGPQ
jgi:PAS domain S-box-containing protein